MKKIFKYLGIGAIALAAMYGIFSSGPLAHAAGAPTVTFNPSWGSYGVNGGSLTVSRGPYTQDFRVTLCLVPTLGGGRNGTPAPTSDPVPAGEPSNAECATTPWASTLGVGSLYTGGLSTIWAGQAQDDPFWCNGANCAPYITVETRPLPTGMSIEDMTLGIEFADDNSSPPSPSYQCDMWTPIFGGTSGVAYGYTYGNCYNGSIGQKPNYFRLFINGTDLTFGANGAGNNIPTTFNASENKTIGTDGSSLQISVTNTGNFAWGEDNSTVIGGTEVGTCDEVYPWYACPDSSRPTGSSCTVGINNWSSDFDLKHISGSFGVGTNPVQLTTPPSTATCTVGPIGCDNNGTNSDGVSCNSSQYVCEDTSTYCIATDPDTGQCTEMSTPCASTWEPQYSLSFGGAPTYSNILPGQTVKFQVGSLTAPSTPGTYTEVWQMNSEGKSGLSGDDYPYAGTFGNPIPISITVTAPAPTSTPGALTIKSENANNPSIAVPASWDISGNVPGGFVCAGVNALFPWQSTPCSGAQQTYSGVPADTDLYSIVAARTSVPDYSFRFIEATTPIAEKKNSNIFESLGLSLKNMVSTIAEAQTFPGGQTLTLTPASPTGTITILWTPNADMQVGPGSVSLSPSSPSQTVTVTNNGAPASQLTWTASSSTASGGNWLVVSPSGGTVTNGASSGGTGSATISFDPSVESGLPNGTYTGTVTINGYTPNGNSQSLVATQTVSVTLTVTGNGPYFSCGAGVCAVSTVPGARSCSTACTGTSGNTVTVTCSPSTVLLGATSQCYANLGGTSQDATWTSTGTAGGSINASGVYSPTGVGTETVTGTLPDGTSGSTSITVWTIPACNGLSSCQATCSPSLTASPSSIVIPESSNLSYSCSNVTHCTLTGGTGLYQGGASVAASDTIPVDPSITTTYTLSCVNTGYTDSSASSSATITVGGTIFCEQNPNGAGCPGR